MNKQRANVTKAFKGPSQLSPRAREEPPMEEDIQNVNTLVRVESEQYFDLCSTETFTKDMRDKYIEAIDFVNFCHRLMNKLLRKKCSHSGDTEDHLKDFKLPETANYLGVFDLLLQRIADDYQRCLEHAPDIDPPKEVTHVNNKELNADNVKNCKSVKASIQKHLQETSPTRNSTVIKNNAIRNNKKDIANMNKKLLHKKVKQSNLEQMVSAAPENKLQEDEPSNNIIHNDDNINTGKTTSKGVNNKPLNQLFPSKDNTSKGNENLRNIPDTSHSCNNERTPLKEQKSTLDESCNTECDKYLMNIIQSQIQKFMSSSHGESGYETQKEDINIDDFKIVKKPSVTNIDEYYIKEDISGKTNKSNRTQSLHISRAGYLDTHVTCKDQCSQVNIETSSHLGERNSATRMTDVSTKLVYQPSKMMDDDIYSPNCETYNSNDFYPVCKESCLSYSNDGESSIYSDDEMEFSMISKGETNAEKNTRRCDTIPNKNIEKVLNVFTQQKKKKNVGQVKEMPPKSSKKKASHPLDLNERDLNSLDKDVLSTIGLFSDNGQVRPEVLEFLKMAKEMRKNDSRNKQFRKSRDSSEASVEIGEIHAVGMAAVMSVSGDSSSEIRSDSEFDKK